jgi:acyl dehydratase
VAEPLDFEQLDKGTPIEGLTIPALTRVALARFAGAVDDYNPMHLDDKVAAASGKSSVFAPTNLIMAYVGRMVQNWLVGAVLRRFELKVVRLVWPGDVLTCRGTIIDKRQEGAFYIIDADVSADNQRGENVANGLILAVIPKTPGKANAKEAEMGVVIHPARAGKGAAKKAPAKKKR